MYGHCYYTIQGHWNCIEPFANGSSLPDGEYQRDCKECTYNPLAVGGGTLENCVCNDLNGTTFINPPFAAAQCTSSGGVIGINGTGKLVCNFPLPEGSYQNSCLYCNTDLQQTYLDDCRCFNHESGKYAEVPRGTLGADCKTGNNDINFVDGTWKCGGKIPNGDSLRDCYNCYFDSSNNTLSGCICPNDNKDGYVKNGSIDVKTCTGLGFKIELDNGNLVCKPPSAKSESSSKKK